MKKEKGWKVVPMLYHVSSNAGLKTLYPHVSSHKKAYVYAINNFVTGLLFGVKQDDFDFCISTDKNGLTIVDFWFGFLIFMAKEIALLL